MRTIIQGGNTLKIIHVLIILAMVSPIGTASSLESINPDDLESDPNYWYEQAISNRDDGEYPYGLREIETAIELDPNNSTYWSFKGWRTAELEPFEKAIELDSNNADAWDGKAFVHTFLDEYEDALEAANRSIELNGTNMNFWIRKSDVYSSNHRITRAVETLDEAIAAGVDGQPAILYKKASILFDAHRYGDALEAINDAINLCENLSESSDIYEECPLHIGLKANILDKLGLHNESIELRKKVIKEWPDAEEYMKLAQSYFEFGENKEACKAFDKVLELDAKESNELDLSDFGRWQDCEEAQEMAGLNKTYYTRDFFTDVDGEGVVFFLSFVDAETGEYVTPEGKLFVTLSPRGGFPIYYHIYDIKKKDYDSYVGGIAIQKFVSSELLSRKYKKLPQVFVGNFVFRDTDCIFAARKEQI